MPHTTSFFDRNYGIICVQIVLTEAQREEKKAVEAELAFAKSEFSKEFDPMKSKTLKEEVVLMEKKLGELLDTFEVSSELSGLLYKNCELLGDLVRYVLT